MDIYVKIIDKNDKNTWRTIYKAIYAPYFGKVRLFPKEFLDHYKNHPNEQQNIPYQIKKKIKTNVLEESLYAKVVMIR